jgi:uncharacterized protein YjbI with pentapeptide repeats
MLFELKKFSRPTIVLICVFGVVLVRWILPPIFWPGGIGIGKDSPVSTKTIEKDAQGKTLKTIETIKYDDGKTLWDWLSLLGVPLSLAILGYFLQLQQQKRAEELSNEQQKRAEELSENQRKIADNATKEEVLQTYFDRLSVLLIDKNLVVLSNKSNSSTITPEEQELLDSSLDVIRARTLSILRRFENDLKRKGSVINFLIETDIVGKSKLNLEGAKLEGAYLGEANLKGANLKGAYLGEANLKGTNLGGAILEGANLEGAILVGANLGGAILEGANLEGAILVGANLKGTNLKGTNLKGADLEWAKLEGAILVGADLGGAKLQRAYLEGAILVEAYLEGAILVGANLVRANLDRASLVGANLVGTNLQWANLQWTNLKDIQWDSETIWPDKSAFNDATNIPEELKKELGITP